MRDLVSHVAGSIRSHRLFQRGARILVAVSGGVDSMVLLEILRQLAPEHDWTLGIAHFNHRLRGRSSDADEQLVRRTAKQSGLRFLIGDGDVRSLARSHGISIEMAARTLRHRFLARAARRFSADAVALAHHADDQVELYFLRLLRGAGPRGLRGMPWKNRSPVDPAAPLVRPLLDLGKSDLQQFARDERVVFREDTSNRSPDFLRNRIRSHLLPLLKRSYQSALPAVIGRQIEILSAESDLLDELADRWLKATRRRPFDRLPLALQRRVLQKQLHALGTDPEFESIEKLRLEADTPVEISPSLTLRRNPCGIVCPVHARSLNFSRRRTAVRLAGTAAHGEFDGLHWRASIARGRNATPEFGRGREYFDADRVGRTFILRHWKEGDRFQPSGMPQPAKLQDLFTNLKVPAEERRRRVIATTADGELWWVEGLRIAEQFKIRPATRRLLRWQWSRP